MKRNEDRLIQENKKLKKEKQSLKNEITEQKREIETLKMQLDDAYKGLNRQTERLCYLRDEKNDLSALYDREKRLTDKLLELLELKMKGKA